MPIARVGLLAVSGVRVYNTFVDTRWSRVLARAIAEAEVHWFTETDVSVADDPELLDLLATSGCRQVLIGFESPSVESLRGIEARIPRPRGVERAPRRSAPP